MTDHPGIRFSKYHGTGNDFILIDNRLYDWNPTRDLIARLCDRHFGVGADGLMLLSSSKDSDFSMTYFNADGGESTMCGNGGRCISAFARQLGIAGEHVKFTAIDGLHEAVLLHQDGMRSRLRLKLKDTRIDRVYDDGVFIDTGSPHFVVPCVDVAPKDVRSEGRVLRNDHRFEPGGTNVDFMYHDKDRCQVRTYERGVEDETLSCGTGVTAAALVSAWLLNKGSGVREIATPGGVLKVHYTRSERQFSEIWLEGDVERVFDGTCFIGTTQSPDHG